SYIALPLTLLVLLAGYNHDKGHVRPGERPAHPWGLIRKRPASFELKPTH
ncbi:NOMO3 isoform 3, partial [Pan troglodytes]